MNKFKNWKNKLYEKIFGEVCIKCGEIWYSYSGVKSKKGTFICPDCFLLDENAETLSDKK